MKTIITTLLLLVSFQSFATTVLSINTEFMWESKEPHEGQIAFGAIGIHYHQSMFNLRLLQSRKLLNTTMQILLV
jgi:hypothetical protein